MEKMYCPKCHEELSKDIKREFETLSDHVCNPNMTNYPLRPTFICKNEECSLSKKDIFWDEMGALYGWLDEEIKAPYPSFQRRIDVEIYKKGVKSKIYLHPCLMLWFLKPMIEFTYKADDYGNILKRGYKLIWLKKDTWKPWKKDDFGYHTHYTFPIMNIIHHIKHNIDTIKNCSVNYKEHNKKELLKPLPEWDKRWWRKVEKFLDKNIFYNLY
jgi:hypothetical protein